MSNQAIAFIVVLAIAFLGVVNFMHKIVRPWIKALVAGHKLELSQIVKAKLRGVSPDLIVDAFLVLRFRDVEIDFDQLLNIYFDRRVSIETAHDLVDQVDQSK